MTRDKTYAIPGPPDADITELRDGTGRIYTRCDAAGEYWISEALGPGRGTYAWVDLLFQRGEVRPA